MKRLISVLIALLCCAGMPNQLNAQGNVPIYVGVIEDIDWNENTTITSTVHARIAFQKNDGNWTASKTDFQYLDAPTQVDRYYPATVKWTVAFAGKQIGNITSKNPGPLHSYCDIGTQIITSPAKDIPRISTRSSDFSYSVGTARTRPLLLVSAPYFKDPGNWKPTSLSTAERKLAIKEFRKRFPALEQCDAPEQRPIHMVPYSDDQIVFIKAYRSKNGEVLFGQKLNESKSKCGFFDDEHFFDYWFVLNKKQGVRLLGSQMTPLDAADLDNNGESEWIFQTRRGEDEDGYELFYDDFSRKAAFHWKYH